MRTPKDSIMSESNQFDVPINERTPSRWRTSTSMALQLALIVLVAVLAGLFIFPL
jgi:hypothetical protein